MHLKLIKEKRTEARKNCRQQQGLSEETKIEPEFLSIAFQEINKRELTIIETGYLEELLALYSSTKEELEDEDFIDIKKVSSTKEKSKKIGKKLSSKNQDLLENENSKTNYDNNSTSTKKKKSKEKKQEIFI